MNKTAVQTNNGEAVLINKNFTKGLSLRGYTSEDFKKLEIFKSIDPNEYKEIFSEKNIAIGKELSFDLNLDVGDSILLMSPVGEETIIGNLPKQEKFKISYIFDSGLIEFDQNVAFLNIRSLENLMNLDSNNRNIEIYLNDPLDIENAKKEFQKIYSSHFVYTLSLIHISEPTRRS